MNKIPPFFLGDNFHAATKGRKLQYVGDEVSMGEGKERKGPVKGTMGTGSSVCMIRINPASLTVWRG